LLHVELTSDLDWNPYADEFAKHETIITMASETRSTSKLDTVETHSTLGHSNPPIVEWDSVERNDMADRLIGMLRHNAGRPLDEVMVAREVQAVVRSEGKLEITPVEVAKRWKIGLDVAARTLIATKQLGVRMLKHPAQRRFWTAYAASQVSTLEGDTLCRYDVFYGQISVRFQVCTPDREWIGFLKVCSDGIKSRCTFVLKCIHTKSRGDGEPRG
jgi:hypothetical protein